MAGEKIKIVEQAISEILIADTNLESGDVAGDVEEYFEEEDEDGGGNDDNKDNTPPQKWQQVADYQPGDCLKE
jgi:hypothetical protein